MIRDPFPAWRRKDFFHIPICKCIRKIPGAKDFGRPFMWLETSGESNRTYGDWLV